MEYHKLKTMIIGFDLKSYLLSYKTPSLTIVIMMVLCMMAHNTGAQFKVSTLDFFGYGSLDVSLLRAQAGEISTIKSEQDLNSLLSRIQQIDGVRGVRINRVCCDDAGHHIFIAVTTAIEKVHRFGKNNRTAYRLPGRLLLVYQNYLKQLQRAVSAGLDRDDLSRGFSVMEDTSVRAIQLSLPDSTVGYQREIAKVLLGSSIEEQRAQRRSYWAIVLTKGHH